MKGYLAYFDILGFKAIVENNDLATLDRYMENLVFLPSSMALTGNKFTPEFISDINESKINCLYISDSIIFFIEENQIELLNEFISVCFKFNLQSALCGLPLRGAIVFGEFSYNPTNKTSSNTSTWINSSLYGKALVQAYQLADAQEWAGCIVHSDVINKIHSIGGHKEIKENLKLNTKIYPVPIKAKDTKSIIKVDYSVFNLVEKYPLDKTAYTNVEKNIVRNFSNYGKSLDTQSAVQKLENTIEFLKTFSDPQ